MLIVTIVVLAVSIIGIPLLVLVPFALVALVLVFATGFTAVAGRVGTMFADRTSRTLTPAGAAAAGVLILLTPAVLACLMFLAGGFFSVFGVMLTIVAVIVEFSAWTVGFGAAILARFSTARIPNP
jgi:hypothetical protein